MPTQSCGEIWIGGRRSRFGEIKVARTFTACMVSLAACALLLLGGCGKPGGGAQSAPAPQVTVAQVLEKRVKDWDEFTGRLQAIETVEIRPRVSGYIDKVAFKEGGLVKSGTLLFVIDPRPYQAEYDRAAADLKRYKTALDLARSNRRACSDCGKAAPCRKKSSMSA